MEATAYIGLGTNLGHREAQLQQAIARLAPLVSHGDITTAPLYETEPVGGPEQPHYLNTVAAFRTVLGPSALLQALLDIEEAMGRIRLERWGPRCIDLDLLLFGDQLMEKTTPLDLVIPHPRMHLRRFVLQPLSDIAPDLIHPRLNQTILELLASCPDNTLVIPYEAQI